MATTKEIKPKYAGLYTNIREYRRERSALFGLITWEEIVCTERIDDDVILKIVTKEEPTRIIMNGEPYKLVKLEF